MTDYFLLYLMAANALINIILIFRYNLKNKSEKYVRQAYGGRFWAAYLYFIPFFVTMSIIKEIDKTNKKVDLKTQYYDRLIDSWKRGAKDLHLKIKTPFIIKQGGESIYPIIIKEFGNHLGTIIVLENDNINLEKAKKCGYNCELVDSVKFSFYNRRLFIKTLTEWGFYGDDEDKPEWYFKDLSIYNNEAHTANKVYKP